MSTAIFTPWGKKYRSYTFGALSPFADATLDIFIDAFAQQPGRKPQRLEGRAAPRFTSIPEAGPVVIKFYQRGGWLSRINREKYLKIFKTRSRKEFEFLIRAERAGVTVPTTVAFASRGFPFYKAWLITKAIAGPTSFAQLCLDEKDKSLRLMPEISRNIRLLIQNNIHHVDLHPGNIIVDKDDKPYFIDFDKARYCSAATREGLAKKYQRRWTRAIRKYNLPDTLTDLLLTEARPFV